MLAQAVYNGGEEVVFCMALLFPWFVGMFLLSQNRTTLGTAVRSVYVGIQGHSTNKR